MRQKKTKLFVQFNPETIFNISQNGKESIVSLPGTRGRFVIPFRFIEKLDESKKNLTLIDGFEPYLYKDYLAFIKCKRGIKNFSDLTLTIRVIIGLGADYADGGHPRVPFKSDSFDSFVSIAPVSFVNEIRNEKTDKVIWKNGGAS